MRGPGWGFERRRVCGKIIRVKPLRVLVLCLLALGVPLQGWATVSQAFCRMAPAALADSWALHAPLGHADHPGHAHDNTFEGVHAMGHGHPDTPTLSEVLHHCGHCAQCAAAHVMASFSAFAMAWPQAHPVWVGAEPRLLGRVFVSAPERPPRTLLI